jgi:hypothetical protein
VKAVALLLVVATGGAAWASASADYAPASTEWNGLSRLFEVARESHCTIKAEDELDWSSLQATDVLWFVYPRAPIDAQNLHRWLASGGRAVIADDFGAAGPALHSLGIGRGPAAPAGVARFFGNPNLPIAAGDPRYELGRATSELVANHPTTLQSTLPATYAFAPGAALVVEGRIEGHTPPGSFVAIADPSVLINNMLELDGNRAFAEALVARTCRPGRDTIHLYTQTFLSHGSPPRQSVEPADPSKSPGAAHFNQSLERANQTLHDFISRDDRVWLAAGISLVTLLVLGGAFPARSFIRDRWTRVGRLALDEPHPLDQAWDHSGPTGVLREETLERLEAALGERVDFDRTGPQAIAHKVEARFGAPASRSAAELWRRLHAIGWRTVDGEVMPARRVSRRALLHLHRLATALFADLET